MKIEISSQNLVKLVIKQIENLFLLEKNEVGVLEKEIHRALDRCAFCFSHTNNKYYKYDDLVYFNPFHSGQYSIFLYYLSNSIYVNTLCKSLADRVYYLNKSLNSLDLFYEVNLPKIFMLDHPVGSVLGRACYGEFFSFSQNCTVGQNKGIYPVIGTHVSMLSGSKIVGDCTIGDNVILSANAYVKDTDIPSNSLVFGHSPNLIIKYMKSTADSESTLGA